MHSATQRCETVLVACGAGATLQRLEKQILPADMTHIEGDTAHPQALSPAQHAAKDLKRHLEHGPADVAKAAANVRDSIVQPDSVIKDLETGDKAEKAVIPGGEGERDFEASVRRDEAKAKHASAKEVNGLANQAAEEAAQDAKQAMTRVHAAQRAADKAEQGLVSTEAVAERKLHKVNAAVPDKRVQKLVSRMLESMQTPPRPVEKGGHSLTRALHVHSLMNHVLVKAMDNHGLVGQRHRSPPEEEEVHFHDRTQVHAAPTRETTDHSEEEAVEDAFAKVYADPNAKDGDNLLEEIEDKRSPVPLDPLEDERASPGFPWMGPDAVGALKANAKGTKEGQKGQALWKGPEKAAEDAQKEEVFPLLMEAAQQRLDDDMEQLVTTHPSHPESQTIGQVFDRFGV
jgi:hypothetical protein